VLTLCPRHNHGVRVDELLRGRPAAGITLVAGPWDARPVERIAIIDGVDDLANTAPGALAILTRSASSRAAGYELDFVLRHAGDRELAAVALYGPPTTSLTAIRLADRSRIALLAIAEHVDLSEMAFAMEQSLRSGSDAMLRRIQATLTAVRDAEELTLGSILESAAEALETSIRYTELSEGATAVPVMLGTHAEGHVCADQSDPATEIGCQLVADAIARVRLSLRSSRQAATQARAAALGDVLAAADADVEIAAERGRLLDLALDGSHSVIAIEPFGGGSTGAALLGRVRAVAETHGPEWTVLALDHTVLAVRMRRPAARVTVAEDAATVAAALVGELASRPRASALVCGVSGEHEAILGLRTATYEARAALAAARAESRVNEPLSFEATPVRRLLVELVSSSTAARHSVEALLAPLDQLGPRRARTAVDTLQVYLDERGSLVAAGRRLHLHPNAVGYRMRRIREQLDLDLEDPEQRLALQLACRARVIDAGEAGDRAAFR
jgi:sugar diacid utilization regulator